MPLHTSLTLFRVRGIPIRAHWTLFVILPYLAIALAPQFDKISSLPPLAWGAILAVGLFASVVFHELAHALVAVRFGGRVQSITLMLIGGISQISRLPRGARQEGLVAAAGPLSSLALGGALVLIHVGLGGRAADLSFGLYLLGVMNIWLGAFNLLPAFPMDGGRIVRAGLAAKLGRHRATTIASALGKGCAVLLGLAGVATSNIMLLLIALFVWAGAHEELAAQTMHESIDGLRAVDLLSHRPPPTISAAEPLARILARMDELDRMELVVVGDDGRPIGVLRATDLGRVDPDDGWTTTAGELVRGLPKRHIVVPPRATANEALERAAEERAELVLVVDPDAPPASAIVGLVSTDDIARTVTLRALSTSQAARAGGRPAHGPAA